jgi:hypothetical protein
MPQTIAEQLPRLRESIDESGPADVILAALGALAGV